MEIELKAPWPDLVQMAQRIEQRGGHYMATVRERDTYFSHPGRDFRRSREALRLRQTDRACVMTYKGPPHPGTAKIREELEIPVAAPDMMTAILLRLGFTTAGIVEKERRLYRLDGAVVCLDTVEHLGTYVEIEKIGEDASALEADVLAIAAALGLTIFERRSYLTLRLEGPAAADD